MTCSRGVKITADCKIHECEEHDWDAVVCPGGMPGATNLKDNTTLESLLWKQVINECNWRYKRETKGSVCVMTARNNLCGCWVVFRGAAGRRVSFRIMMLTVSPSWSLSYNREIRRRLFTHLPPFPGHLICLYLRYFLPVTAAVIVVWRILYAKYPPRQCAIP